MAESIMSDRVKRELAKLKRPDVAKMRLYRWAQAVRQAVRDGPTPDGNVIYLTTYDCRAFYNPSEPLPPDTLQTMSDRLCDMVGMPRVIVEIRDFTIKGPDGVRIPASAAPRFHRPRSVWIHPDMRHRLTLAHEIGHWAALFYAWTWGHGPNMTGWHALLLSRLVPGDQVALDERIRKSMTRYGLHPESARFGGRQ